MTKIVSIKDPEKTSYNNLAIKVSNGVPYPLKADAKR
jgi:hypothetical protein